MYKTISINNNTFQQLNALALKLQKAKSQVVADLVRERIEKMHEDEKNALKNFNAAVKKLAKRIKLPSGTFIDIASQDSYLGTLKDMKEVKKIDKSEANSIQHK